MHRLKILLISKTFTKGGAASGARNLLGALRAAGAEVIALDAYETLAVRPVRLLRVAERVCERVVSDAETHFARIGPPIFDLAHVYSQHRPDVIQLCDVSGNTVRFDDIARVPCPVVHRMSDFWPYHGARHYAEAAPSSPSLADNLLRRMIFDGRHRPTFRVAPSKWLASRLGGDDTRVIRNAVDLAASASSRRAAPGRIRFGFISAKVMDPRKGFSALPVYLRAFAASASVPVDLHVFGHAFRRSIPDFGVVNITHHPPFTKADLERVYDSFDILLCPSRLDNSPNVVTEALAYGVPTIGQAGTGMDSYICEDTGGLVDFHADGEAEAQRFVTVCSHILANYEDFSAQAIRYAQHELAPAAIGAEYLKLYDELLGQGHI